jgi:hypothetical protein
LKRTKGRTVDTAMVTTCWQSGIWRCNSNAIATAVADVGLVNLVRVIGWDRCAVPMAPIHQNRATNGLGPWTRAVGV